MPDALDIYAALDPELLRSAAVAGRRLVEGTLVAAGLSSEDAADQADAIIQLLSDARYDVPPPATDELTSLEDSLENRLRELQAEVDDGDMLFAKLAAISDTVPLATSDPKHRRRMALLALVVWVSVAPTFTIKSDQGGVAFQVSNEPVIVEVVSRVMDSVDKAIEAYRQTHAVPPSGPAEPAREPPPDNTHPGSAASVGSAQLPAPAIGAPRAITDLTEVGKIQGMLAAGGSSVVSMLSSDLVDFGAGNFGIPDREAANKLAGICYQKFNEYVLESGLSDEVGKELFREKVRSWERPAPFTFDVGLRPERTGNRIAYRLAIRVQSPTEFRSRGWNRIRQALGAALRGTASIRRIGEVKAAVRTAQQDSGKRSPRGHRISHGHSISVQFGPAGTICGFARDKSSGIYIALTAGHVVSKLGKSDRVLGELAFSPAFVDPWDRPFGTVRLASLITRPWFAAPTPNGAAEVDFAGIEIKDGTLIADPNFRHFDGNIGLKCQTAALTDADIADHVRVIKASSLTKQCLATVQAAYHEVAITYPETMRTVAATGLIEVELATQVAAKPGESGTACVTQDGALLGFVVAGSDRGYIYQATIGRSPSFMSSPCIRS